MSDQKNWDAAVIRTWRRSGSVQDAILLFRDLSGKQTSDCDPPLKRLPPPRYPWNISMRVFVANHLSKISKRLWEQEPDKDILLLRKLETSAYDTEADIIDDLDLARERSQDYRNRKKVQMSALEYSNRNQATNWGVTKGAARIRMKR